MNRLFLILVVFVSLIGPSQRTLAMTMAEPLPEKAAREVIAAYGRWMASAWKDAAEATQLLETSCQKLIEQPSEETLQAARRQWQAARQSYLRTEVSRFYGGPIDDDRGYEARINSWPIDESYMEGSAEVPGLIDDDKRLPEITAKALARLNAEDGETNICCGWHAVEYLLWGRDTSAMGPGSRPWTDYSSAPHAPRRGDFLRACVGLLTSDVRKVASEWQETSPGSFRHQFSLDPVADSIGDIVTGIYQLAGFELADERLMTGLDTQEQEEEPDCFSDTTHIGFAPGIKAIDSLCEGHWPDGKGQIIEGPGLFSLMEMVNPEMVSELKLKLAEAKKLSAALPAPFDQALLKDDEDDPARQPYLQLAETLDSFADLLAHFARSQGWEVNFEPHTE